MDLPALPTGLAPAIVAVAVAGMAAGALAWKRRRGAGPQREAGGAEASPHTQAAMASAHALEARAVIEQASAAAARAGADTASRADAPARELEAAIPSGAALAQFEGPAWATTEPMPGIAVEPPFADTMPAEMPAELVGASQAAAETPFAPTNFAATGFAATNFASTNFADTMPAEISASIPRRFDDAQPPEPAESGGRGAPAPGRRPRG